MQNGFSLWLLQFRVSHFPLNRYGTERPERRKTHMQRCSMGPAEKSIEEKNLFIDQSLNDFRATVMEISEHIYVNPRSLEDRLYDKSEVIYMMQQIGHLQVPESVQMQAPAPKLGRSNPTQKKQGPKSVPKNAPNPIAELNDNDSKT